METWQGEGQINRGRLALSVVLLSFGFLSAAVYMGLTIFYPMFHYSEFVGQALRQDMQQLLADRYLTYLPLMIFGTGTLVGGYAVSRSAREFSNGSVFVISIMVLATFLLLAVKFLS
jgi:hypothetical protein